METEKLIYLVATVGVGVLFLITLITPNPVIKVKQLSGKSRSMFENGDSVMDMEGTWYTIENNSGMEVGECYELIPDEDDPGYEDYDPANCNQRN